MVLSVFELFRLCYRWGWLSELQHFILNESCKRARKRGCGRRAAERISERASR